jgi:D-glycero-D-manno-heptose 1,7-bisphosphate phosphatase
MQKAIFLDRDDTIIIDKIDLHKPQDIEYFPDTKAALSLLHQKGYVLFIVTNQSGIARGLFTHQDVAAVHHQIQQDVQSWGLPTFLDIAYCPHGSWENCECRKPKSGLVLDLIEKWNISPEQSYMIGDRIRDAEAGYGAGTKGAILGKKETDHRFPNFTTLLEFAQYVS